MKLLENRVETCCADLSAFSCDVLVNAANASLYGGGGVDGALHRAAGPALLEACRKIRKEQYPKGLPTGEAVLTPPGYLPCKGVIHTVGPIWKGGQSGEAELLASCYRKSLHLALKQEYRSIAFPAISTGIYSYPAEQAARVVYHTLKDVLKDHSIQVYLVFFSATNETQFLNSLDGLIQERGLS